MDTSIACRVAREASDYKSDIKPVWCSGCGDYSVLLALTKAMASLSLPPENVAVVSGIGCSSRIPAYTSTYGFHGVHGRALATATGLKAARPELTVICTGGDGDGFSIGGNHFVHACRRNMDITYVVMDNQVYGMTKGQSSPTTDPSRDSALTPGGTGVSPFYPLVIALASGANFLARTFAGDPKGTAAIIEEAITYPGFAFVQILSPCVTYRPDQKEWRNMVRKVSVEPTSDLGVAAKRLMLDDGFNTGILYKGKRKAFKLTQNNEMTGEYDFTSQFEI